MKKILTIILAGLLLVGLAGCSGALHNKGLLSGSETKIIGDVDGWSGTLMTEVSLTEWTCEINYTGDNEPKCKFCIRLADNWSSRYTAEDKTLTVDGDAIEFKFIEGGDPKHAKFSAIKDKTYIFTAKADNGKLLVSVAEKK